MLVISGNEIPGTDWILDGRKIPLAYTPKERTWWDHGDYQTRPRAEKIDLLIGHWTGGEAGVSTYDDDGPRVVYGMKRRTSTTRVGKPLKCSVAFVIGACSPSDYYAPVWQCLDIGTTAGVSVGAGSVNSRALAVECVSAGQPGKLDIRKRAQSTLVLNGKPQRVLSFYPGQIRSWTRLANLLTLNSDPHFTAEQQAIVDGLDSAGIHIPRRVPGSGGSILASRMTRKQTERWAGVMEHMHMYDTRKLDAATQLCAASLLGGFELVNV